MKIYIILLQNNRKLKKCKKEKKVNNREINKY